MAVSPGQRAGEVRMSVERPIAGGLIVEGADATTLGIGWAAAG